MIYIIILYHNNSISLYTYNMTIYNKYIPQLNIRTHLIKNIKDIILYYSTSYKMKSLWFNEPIDGLTYYDQYPHYDPNHIEYDWTSDKIKNITLLRIFYCLKNKNFYMYCYIDNNKVIKIKPKNV